MRKKDTRFNSSVRHGRDNWFTHICWFEMRPSQCIALAGQEQARTQIGLISLTHYRSRCKLRSGFNEVKW